MESSEREPSYYEVALTHRQLMVGLVVALTTVVVAFLAGVWIGRGGGPPGGTVQVASTPGTATPAENVDQLTFFGDKKGAARPASKPTPIAPKSAAPAPAPTPAETEAEALRKTLEAEMAANRVEGTGPEASAPAPAPAAAPGARVTRDAAAPAKRQPAAKERANRAPEAPNATVAAGKLWIQVYSSTNRERANEISARLKKSGFLVRTLEPTSVSGPNLRVRVGPYADRTRADRDASRLRREFKLDTWVTDSP